MADVNVQKFADLARVYITKEEAEKFEREVETILGYISRLEEVEGGKLNVGSEITNLWDRTNAWREDGEAHEARKYTKELLAESPEVKDDRVKVKKIL